MSKTLHVGGERGQYRSRTPPPLIIRQRSPTWSKRGVSEEVEAEAMDPWIVVKKKGKRRGGRGGQTTGVTFGTEANRLDIHRVRKALGKTKNELALSPWVTKTSSDIAGKLTGMLVGGTK